MNVDQLLDREILAAMDEAYPVSVRRIRLRLIAARRLPEGDDGQRLRDMADLRRRLKRMGYQKLVHQVDRTSINYWVQGPKPCI